MQKKKKRCRDSYILREYLEQVLRKGYCKHGDGDVWTTDSLRSSSSGNPGRYRNQLPQT